MQPTQHAEAEEEWKLAQGVPRRLAIQPHRDGPTQLLLSVWWSDGGGHNV